MKWLMAFLLTALPTISSLAADDSSIRVTETADSLVIDTDTITAKIIKKGYVSGIGQGSLLDKKTGARDLGFGLHIMDFLMAPGWREDEYTREAKYHGNLPKHYVEGPQVCTQAKVLTPEIIRGKGFVAVKLRYTFNQPGAGYKAGSTWEQTLVFQPGVRYVIGSERIHSVNDVDNLFYRIDMPGHIRHKDGDTFEQVYLSYRNKPIPSSEFRESFAPDAKFLYQRDDSKIPDRMIRGYQVKLDGRPGPWLVGMTLDPAAVSEAWCHQRGYICFIQELHKRHVKAGQSFGAAYVVGWFDDIPAMEHVYDMHRGATRIVIDNQKFELKPESESPTIFEPGAKLTVIADNGAGGEGPAYDPEMGIFSSGNGDINRRSPDGKSQVFRKGAGTNGLLFDPTGRLIACDSEHHRVVRFDRDGKMKVLTESYQGKRYNTPNDLTLDSKGRIYFSDPRYGDRKGMEQVDAQGRTIEGVYRIDPDGKVTRVIGREVKRANGVLVSADDRYLFVADNNNDLGGARKLYRFDLKADGSVDVNSQKLLHDWGKGRGPDGLKQDQSGRLYVAGGLNKPNPPSEPAEDVKGGIYVFSPDGKLLTFLPVPTDEVTNCAFGGEDRRTLYITGGGTLYSMRTMTPGRVTWPRGK